MLALGLQRSPPLVTSLEDLGVEHKDFEIVQGGSTFMELTDLHKKENRMQANVMERAAPGAALVLEESVEVSLPVSEVYQRWLDVEHYPEFMENVEAIRPLGGGRYHWIARLFGAKQEWDTEITDQQENQRIAWRSLDGPLQAGSVTLQPLPNNATLVRLRMESTPPGGVVGQRLEHLTHLSRRLLRRNLENFAHLVKEERTPGMGGVLRPGIRPLANALAFPVGAGLLGGLVAYPLVRRRYPVRTRLLWRRQRLTRIERRGAIASWLITLASVACLFIAANYRRQGQATKAIVVGQYTPTILGLGILARLMSQRALKPMLPGAIASWALTSAAGASVISSVLAHLRGRRKEGLFIGHWAPTFLVAALLCRLINRE